MDNLVCTECGTTYYSAAARLMIDRGERCDCGGLLEPREPDAEARVTVAAGGQGRPHVTARNGRRRFAR